MTHQTIFIVLPGLIIILAVAVLVWGLIRRFRKELGVRNEEREKPTDMSFIIGAFHEVTKQLKEKEKQLERLRALAEQRAENVESYNENILQCVTSGVMTFDIHCRLTTINRAAEEILSVSREKVIGKSCIELFGDGSVAETVAGTIERKMPSARMEAMLDRTGGRIWLGYNTAVLADRHNAAIGIILSFSDLTEVKRLQEQMELRERLTALGEMSAGIAHELRNPMAVISGYLNLLSKKTDAAAQETIRSIVGEIAGMNRIIGDLLTFARPASINRVTVNLKEMIESCLSGVLQAKGEGPAVTTDMNIENIEIAVDEVLMRQAFTNLIQNAVEAMPDGGTLSIGAQGKKECRIVIRDSGTGMPPESLKKIFLPFYTTKDKGVGLGLALVHKIVLSHGGRIDVESMEGQGTTFRVALPMR